MKNKTLTAKLTKVFIALLFLPGIVFGQTSEERIKRAEEYNRQIQADLATLAKQIKQSEYGKYFARVESGVDTITFVTPKAKLWRKIPAEKRVLIVKDWWRHWHALRKPHEAADFMLQVFTTGVKARVDCFAAIGGEPFCAY